MNILTALIIAQLAVAEIQIVSEPSRHIPDATQKVDARRERIDATSPITLAPDPDHPDLIAFRERWKEPGRKTYTEPLKQTAQIFNHSQNIKAAVTEPASSVKAVPPAAVAAKPASSPGVIAAPPPPIEQAVMQWQCVGGVCSCGARGEPADKASSADVQAWTFSETLMDDEQPDTRGPAIVVTGSVLVGFKFYGPFDSIDEAIQWWQSSFAVIIKRPCTVALLQQPIPSNPGELPCVLESV